MDIFRILRKRLLVRNQLLSINHVDSQNAILQSLVPIIKSLISANITRSSACSTSHGTMERQFLVAFSITIINKNGHSLMHAYFNFKLSTASLGTTSSSFRHGVQAHYQSYQIFRNSQLPQSSWDQFPVNTVESFFEINKFVMQVFILFRKHFNQLSNKNGIRS